MLLRHARTSVTTYALGVGIALLLSVGLSVGFATAADASPSFADTSATGVSDAVEALAAEGVVSGCGDGAFCPWEPLTRAQMATVLVSALELPTVDLSTATDVGPFVDLGDSVHADNIELLAEAGIVQGCAGDAYCPQRPVTRGQMATMVAAAFHLGPTDGEFFDDAGGTHGPAVDRLAAAGIAAGCEESLTLFCTDAPILRAQSAIFFARAMDLVDRIELAPLHERRQQQADLDAEAEAAAAAARKAEAEAAAAAEAKAAKAEAEAATSSRDKIWDDLARCEAGGNWAINTGNGYYGGLQFSLSSWRWVGGSGYPHQASRAEQIRRGEILLSKQGWGAWPACSRKLGYR